MGVTSRTTTQNSSVNIRGSKMFKAIVAMEIGTDDQVTTGDVIPICELPPEAIVTSIKMLNDALDGASDFVVDIGIWGTTKAAVSLDDILANEADAEVFDIDIYVDGMSALQAAVTTLTEYLGAGTNTVDIDDRFSTVRTLAGHTLASGTMPAKYFLGMKTTVDSATPAAGGIYAEIEWVQG